MTLLFTNCTVSIALYSDSPSNADTEDNDNTSVASTPLNSDNDGDTDVVYDIDSDNFDIILEKPAESAQAELGMHLLILSHATHLSYMSFPDRLAKDWSSPIYMFFNRSPCIEYINNRRVYIFECAASHCKGKHGRDVRRFLDMGDAKSTSSLRRHARMCWGDEAVDAADNTKDLSAARTVLAKSGLKKNGSITNAFERISKEKVTYSHRQYTYMQTR